ncbi:hypothetical protein BLNAU_17060 [Blattamonas nauphoetae]|uniref:Uncharacterized protein n=1 Tax=Blattamonas nauphoetae TaxID=2049346 RepID=A0ABQ9XAY1_9EUKA|nr:hypothetical protein BLNAU_17060 [Blattamonas nauphoetae]
MPLRQTRLCSSLRWVVCLDATICSPIPSVVSAALEFLTRLVQVSSDSARMELVQHGVLDAVFVSVSSSSFLEDYENGVALIGTLLDTVRRVEQMSQVIHFDFSQIGRYLCQDLCTETISSQLRYRSNNQSEYSPRSSKTHVRIENGNRIVECVQCQLVYLGKIVPTF